MRWLRKVCPHFWTDPKVTEEMTPEDRYIFLYLLTNRHTTQIGIYQILLKQMAFDTGYSLETVRSIFERLQGQHGVLRYNWETNEVAIKNWGKYNLTRGGKPTLDYVRSQLAQVKDRSLIRYVGEEVHHEAIRQLFLEAAESSEAPDTAMEPLLSDEACEGAMIFYQDNFGELS